MFLSTHYTHDRGTVHVELNTICCHHGYDTTFLAQAAPHPGFKKWTGLAFLIPIGLQTHGPAGSALDQLIQGTYIGNEGILSLDHLKIAVTLFGMCELPEPQIVWLRKG